MANYMSNEEILYILAMLNEPDSKQERIRRELMKEFVFDQEGEGE